MYVCTRLCAYVLIFICVYAYLHVWYVYGICVRIILMSMYRRKFRRQTSSKSAPNLVCFVHFDFEMCLAPQRRALLRQLNLQKCSGVGVFCTYWIGHVLRAAMAYTFSTAQFLKAFQSWGVLAFWLRNVLRTTPACFFDMSTSKSCPALKCFVHFDLEMCFAPQRRATFYFSSAQMAPHLPLSVVARSTFRSQKC